MNRPGWSRSGTTGWRSGNGSFFPSLWYRWTSAPGGMLVCVTGVSWAPR